MAVGAPLIGAGAYLAWGWTSPPSSLRSAPSRPAYMRAAAPPRPATTPRSTAAPPPAELQATLAKLARDYKEPVGIAVSEVSRGWIAGVNLAQVFPQQSVSKAWTALAVLDAVDRGRLSLTEPVVMGPGDRSVFYQPISRRIGSQGYNTSVGDLLWHAITQSDNAANDKLMQLAGGPDGVRAQLDARKLGGIRIGGPERDLQARICGMVWRPEYGVGGRFKAERALIPEAVRDVHIQAYLNDPADGATPEGVVRALAALQRGQLLSPRSTAVFLDILRQVRTGSRRLVAGAPHGWTVAHKTGTGQDWSGGSIGINDVGLMTAPDGRSYAVAVFIRNTRQPLSRRQALMQRVSEAVAESWRRGQPAEPARQVAEAARKTPIAPA